MSATNGASAGWGARWRAVMDAAGASAARPLQRGHALARRGVVDDLRVEPGQITATVAEDRATPYRVELRWAQPTASAWDDAVAVLRSEIRFTAALLDGDLPDELADVLAEAGIELVPDLDDLVSSCSCPDRSVVCRHVAAVHAAVGALVDRDPTVLLRLRGRSRQQVLGDLRRGDDGDRPLAASTLDLSRGLEAPHGDLEAIELHPALVDDPAALLGHLGDPPAVDDIRPLVRLVERAAAGAWRLAAGDGSEAADQELLLAELRGQRMASAGSLADALSRDTDAVRAQLDELFELGAVMRTGSGERARYRAASS